MSIISSITNAIKPISPINLDLNTVLTNIKNVEGQINQAITSNLLDNVKTTVPTTIGTISQSMSNQSGIGEFFKNSIPNGLNNYANYTYHIRFSMTNDIQAYNNINPTNPNIKNLQKTIIAESGVTAGFNILSLHAVSLVSSGSKKRGLWIGTDFTIEINEPLGLTLIDKIAISAKELGIINYMKCAYFLEIWFNGYDENGNLLDTNLFYTLHRVIVSNMSAVSTDSVGTRYNITLLNDGMYGDLNNISMLPANTVISASTLGEFFDKLIVNWNTMIANENHDNIQRLKYDILYPKEWRTWTLKNPDAFKQNSRSAPITVLHEDRLDDTVTTITISRGQSIENIVEFVLYVCQEAQAWMLGEDSPSPGAPSLKTHGLIRYVSIYPKVTINGATPKDPVTLDYIRNVTYSLIPTESVEAYVDMQTVVKVQQATTQEKKLQYLISNNRLAKKYEYIYTGKNTEVLNFNLKLENLWSIALPTWLQSNSYDQFAIGKLIDSNSIGHQLIKQTVNRTQLSPSSLIQYIDTVATNTINEFNNIANSTLLEAGNKIASQIKSVTQQLPSLTINKTIPTTSSDSSNYLSNKILSTNLDTGDITKSVVSGIISNNKPKQTTNVVTNRELELSKKFVEDANIVKSASPGLIPIVGMFDTKPMQQQARQNLDQNKIPSNADPTTYLPGTGIIGSILNNIFSSQAYQTIELTIKGDPWWLPGSNLIQNSIVDSIVGSAVGNPSIYNASNQSVNNTYLGGDNEILLEFRTGITINEDTGLADLNNNGSDIFSGLYKVVTVISVFSDGKFTQILNCNKDILFTPQVTNNIDTTGPRVGPQ